MHKDDLDREYSQALRDLKELIRFPTVAWPGFDRSVLFESAERIRALLVDTDFFDCVEVVDHCGIPSVFAQKAPAPGYPTVLLYAHHDVQPAGDPDKWVTPAFSPDERDGRLYGRGAADDKVAIAMHLASVRILKTLNSKIGVRVFIEGEEEILSPNFPKLLKSRRSFFDADVAIIADSGNPDEDTPAITVSLRGSIGATVRVTTLSHAAHSGLGGAVPDALMVMIRLLNSLYDDSGSVAIEGLKTTDPSSVLTDFELTEQALRNEVGVLPDVSLVGRGSISERTWHAPSITIIGLDVENVDLASNTLQPSTQARLALRISPGQGTLEASRLLEQHLRNNTPFNARVEVFDIIAGEPYRAVAGDKYLKAMRCAMEEAWGKRPALIGIGCSIPIVSMLQSEFPQMSLLVTGVEDPKTYAHSPNESLSLKVFRNAIAAQVYFLLSLGGE
ncbi:dipeptidase [Tropheryma whipplei]|uniref:dipeptidase n=1 Tax=Tropheryma whipplei TaxID=2039 RepID=UPI0004B1C395|nr:dipeptidase [Tropheryma whipplei]